MRTVHKNASYTPLVTVTYIVNIIFLISELDNFIWSLEPWDKKFCSCEEFFLLRYLSDRSLHLVLFELHELLGVASRHWIDPRRLLEWLPLDPGGAVGTTKGWVKASSSRHKLVRWFTATHRRWQRRHLPLGEGWGEGRCQEGMLLLLLLLLLLLQLLQLKWDTLTVNELTKKIRALGRDGQHLWTHMYMTQVGAVCEDTFQYDREVS